MKKKNDAIRILLKISLVLLLLYRNFFHIFHQFLYSNSYTIYSLKYIFFISYFENFMNNRGYGFN